jgi:mannitol/fructose-specific phosphotransferase system IIA component (Ntr-type)
MAMHTLRDRPVFALAFDPRYRDAVIWCAWALASSGRARLLVFTGDSPAADAAGTAGLALPNSSRCSFGGAGVNAARSQAMIARPAMVVADWPGAADPYGILAFVSDLNAPAILVRWSNDTMVDRVLIPTTGGPNTLRQLWTARELATRRDCPAEVLHIVHGPADIAGTVFNLATDTALAEVQARAMGMVGPAQVRIADDVVSGVLANVRPHDLLVLGAPSYWRMPTHFHGSIPELISRQTPNPLLMLLGQKPSRIHLREIFWPQMVRLGLKPRTRDEVITTLVDTLVKHRQVPPALRDLLIERALAREQLMSTAVGSETALPHITIPDFHGVVGCLGICPDGVTFDAGHGQRTRFVFLLVTPEDVYDDYLTVVSRIAEQLVLPAVRQELLNCRNPVEVLAVLEPDTRG